MMFQIECETCHATEWVPGVYCGGDIVLFDEYGDVCEHLYENPVYAIIDEEAEFEEE